MAPTKAQRPTIDQELKKWFSDAKRIVLAGIGNPIRKDDFVGVTIIQSLRKKTLLENVMLIECETVPEAFAQQIIDFKPTHVLLIDAAVLDLQPGESIMILPEELASPPAYSSHMLPLRLFCEYVSWMTNARIALLLIQPKETDFGEALSHDLEVSAKKISELLGSILNSRSGA